MAKRTKLKKVTGLFWIPGDAWVEMTEDGLHVLCPDEHGMTERWQFTDRATVNKPSKSDITEGGTIPDAYPPRRIEVAVKLKR
jgi:hypothetical protein